MAHGARFLRGVDEGQGPRVAVQRLEARAAAGGDVAAQVLPFRGEEVHGQGRAEVHDRAAFPAEQVAGGEERGGAVAGEVGRQAFFLLQGGMGRIQEDEAPAAGAQLRLLGGRHGGRRRDGQHLRLLPRHEVRDVLQALLSLVTEGLAEGRAFGEGGLQGRVSYFDNQVGHGGAGKPVKIRIYCKEFKSA